MQGMERSTSVVTSEPVIGGAEPENQDVDPTSRNANAPTSSGASV